MVSKLSLQTEMNSRCQVDIIDMQAQADPWLKLIIVFQDRLTKFVLQRTLQIKRAEQVVHQMMDMFLIFGAPYNLHSDNAESLLILSLTK